MAGPRDYTRSTVFSLAALGEGRCYWPKPPCNQPVTVIINREPVTNLQIAHIRAANPDGPRYIPEMSDDERRAWKNLILLCTPHHIMVDKLKPEDYSIEELEKWKSDRETGGLARLRGLKDLTEDRLQEMLSFSMKEAHREIRGMLDQHKPIDPDAAMLLSEASRHLNMATAETLYEASTTLAPALRAYTEMLYEASHTLAPALNAHTESLSMAARALSPALNEHAETLSNAARYLPGILEELDQRIWQLRRLQGDM